MNTWSNWSGSVVCQPQQIASPASEAELARVVEHAADARQRVRVCGSGHSFVPLCATGDVLVSLDNLAGVESIDAERREAVILAGSKLHGLGEELGRAGLALENQGDVDVQSLAGAVSTGTHGTGRALGSISTQVVGLRFISADGVLREWSLEADSATHRALAVSLGALGILTALRLRLLPAYRLHERIWREPIDECMRRLDERVAATRHFEFFWYPTSDVALCKALHPTDEPPSDLADLEGQRIDHSYRIFPTARNVRFNEMEYALPEEQGPACLLEIRKLMQQSHPQVTWPVEYRTVAADELPLSPNFRRATIAISIHQAAELEHRKFFADAEPIFRAHGGRPHWGKMHSLAAEQLAPLYPEWDAFAKLREQLDPAGMFLNEHLRRVLLGE